MSTNAEFKNRKFKGTFFILEEKAKKLRSIYEPNMEEVVIMRTFVVGHLNSIIAYSMILFLLTIPFLCNALGESIDMLINHQCINEESEKSIYAEPCSEIQALGVVPKKTIFLVIDAKDDWLEIELADSEVLSPTTGWISKESIRKTTYCDGVRTAVVHNPDSSDRLNLREKPQILAQSLGKYYNGAVVAILEEYRDSNWTKVQIGTLIGYMQKAYLIMDCSTTSFADVCPRVMVNNNSGKGLNLREYPRTSSTSLGLYANGTQPLVLGITENWYHVQLGEEVGFMAAHSLTPRLHYSNVASSSSKPSNTPCNAIVTGEISMYKYDSENSLEVITTLPTGEIISVLSSNNGWSKVSTGIREGYVLTKQLQFE